MALIYFEEPRIDEAADGFHGQVVAGGVEMDAFQCLGHVKLSRLAVWLDAVPVEDAVRCIGRSLYLGYEQTGADTMACSGREKMAFAPMNFDLGQ